MKIIYTYCFILFNIVAIAQTNLVVQHQSLKNTPINSIAIQNGNQILVGTGKGLYKIKDFETNALELTNQAVIKMDYDMNNQIWLGLYSNQIASTRAESYNLGISATNIINALTIHNNTVWIGTNDGLFSFSLTKMKEMPHFTTENSKLIGNQINAISTDENGNVWIGTNRGLSIFDGKNWTTFHKGKQITAIERNGNEMWVVAGKTILQYGKQKTWLSISLPVNYAFHTIRDLAFDYNGDLWLASKHVLKYEKATKTFSVYDENTGFSSSMALCLAIDKNNQVWVGTAGKGLFKIKNTEKKVTKEDLVKSDIVIQAPSKPNYEDIVIEEDTKTVVINDIETNTTLTQKSTAESQRTSKPKRKKFSSFNSSNSAKNVQNEKSGFTANRKTRKIKSEKNQPEKTNINFLGSRLIKDGVEIEVEEMQLEIAIWDGQNVDGDSISLYYNGVCILKNFNLTKEREYFKLDINPRITNSLILYAHSNGELGYSTATVAIEGQDTPTQWIVINSDIKKCDRISFKFVY